MAGKNRIEFTMDEEDYERNVTFSQLAGEATSYEQAAMYLKSIAKDYWGNGKGEIADAILSLSKEFEQRAKNTRHKQREYGDLP